ncbi:MAG: serpin family protein [Dehalococcoidia bacterium]
MRRPARPALLAPILLLSLVVAATALAACGGAGGPAAAIVEARSDKERIADPQVSDADLSELVRGNSTFAFDLYRLLSAGDGNLFLSPYSISAALAMTYTGARGETELEMAQALSFLLPQSSLHSAFNALDLALTAEPELTEEQTGDPLQISIANAIWGEQTYEFLPAFLDTLAENYGAGLQLLDFIGNYEAARRTINAWVSDQTEERIPELLEEGTLDDLTRLVLTNAIYFKASWLRPFPTEGTRDGAFHLLDGSEVQTPMMHLNDRMGYGEVDGVEVVPLPYEGGAYAMYALLPPEGEFATFEASLDAERVDSIIDGIGDAMVDLTMPRFEFDSSFDLPETLKELGMVSAFGEADFSGMDGTRNLYITDVVHKAFVAVDEEGTEAAAATGVVVGDVSAPEQVELALDRPFLFLIRHIDTGTILFLGRVLDPTA